MRKIEFILYYVVFITIICFGLFLFFRSMNKKVGFKSSILKIEAQSSLLNGALSLGIGLVFIIILFLAESSPLGFMKIIGDAIIVLVICVLFITMPLNILRESFIELGGGVLQDNSSKLFIEQGIEASLPSSLIKQSSYISKLGSSYFIAVFITSNSDVVNLNTIETFRQDVLDLLIPRFENIKIEVITRGKNATHNLS